MSTVIYLSNQLVQVVIGSPGERKISVERSYEAEAPEGSIINGIVMDEELFVGFMKEFWAMNKLPVKNVTLVVDSSKFVGKVIEMPELNMKKTYDFIAREFSDINRSENCLYSYLPLGAGTGKMKRVYTESVDSEFIRDYMDIFEEIGVHLKSIVSGESSLIRLTAMTIGKVHKTFSLILADSSILTTILWIDGSFYYFNSNRCFHEKDTEEYAGDVARSVSRIVQFMQAHQIEQRMECIVIAGIGRGNLPMYQNAVEQMGILTPVQLYEASALTATAEVDVPKCLRSIGGLAAGNRYLNFLKQYASGSQKKRTQGKRLGINTIPIVVVAIVMQVLFIIALTVMLFRKMTLNQLNEYNESPEVIFGVTEYDMQISKNGYLNSQYEAIVDLDENVNTYPICDSRIMSRIEGCARGYATVSFVSFDAQEGTIQMKASSDSVDQINRFIGQLNEQDIFSNVDYTGYTYNDMTLNWDIHVICTLAESAGR